MSRNIKLITIQNSGKKNKNKMYKDILSSTEKINEILKNRKDKIKNMNYLKYTYFVKVLL